jgi:hypothetical protein
LFGSSDRSAPESEATAVEKSAKPEESKRGYGFATRNVAFYTDKSSEDLYRYKNLSSNYMRSSSPTREEEEDNEDKSTTASAIEKRDSDDEESDKKSASSSRRQRRSKK